MEALLDCGKYFGEVLPETRVGDGTIRENFCVAPPACADRADLAQTAADARELLRSHGRTLVMQSCCFHYCFCTHVLASDVSACNTETGTKICLRETCCVAATTGGSHVGLLQCAKPSCVCEKIVAVSQPLLEKGTHPCPKGGGSRGRVGVGVLDIATEIRVGCKANAR